MNTHKNDLRDLSTRQLPARRRATARLGGMAVNAELLARRELQ